MDTETTSELTMATAAAAIGAGAGSAIGAGVGIAVLGTALSGTLPLAVAGALILELGATALHRHGRSLLMHAADGAAYRIGRRVGRWWNDWRNRSREAQPVGPVVATYARSSIIATRPPDIPSDRAPTAERPRRENRSDRGWYTVGRGPGRMAVELL